MVLTTCVCIGVCSNVCSRHGDIYSCCIYSEMEKKDEGKKAEEEKEGQKGVRERRNRKEKEHAVVCLHHSLCLSSCLPFYVICADDMPHSVCPSVVSQTFFLMLSVACTFMSVLRRRKRRKTRKKAKSVCGSPIQWPVNSACGRARGVAALLILCHDYFDILLS